MQRPAMSEHQIHRDRTQEFVVLRRAAAQQQHWLQGKGGQHPEAIAPGETAPPSWARAVQHFNEMEQAVAVRAERLYAAQRDVFAPRFGAGSEAQEEEERAEVERLAADVQKFLKELERLVSSGIRLRAEANSDEHRAAESVRRHLSGRLAKHLTTFKQAQTGYAEQLKKREAKRREFRTFGDADLHEKLQKEEKIASYMEQGRTQVEIQELLTLDAQAQEQSKEVQGVLESIQELHSMFADLRDMVVEQGTLLDRIDYNLEQTEVKVVEGVKELKKARDHQKCVVA